MDGVLAKWEAAITSRLSTPPATGAAAKGVRAAAEAACTTDLERMAVRLVEEKDGVMELARGLRELPVVAAGAVNVSAFPRLRRLADAHGAVPTTKLRALATRLRIGLPADDDGSQEARALWVWRLAELERSVTVRAFAWLAEARTQDQWHEAVAALEESGRFSAEWMTSAREAKRAAAATAAAARAAGSGWSRAIGPLAAIGKLTKPVVDANAGVLDEPKAVVKQAAIATQLLHGINLQGASYDTWRNTVGMALLGVMKRYNHGLDRLPIISATRAEAISEIQQFCSPLDGFPAPAAPAPAARPAGTAAGTAASGGSATASTTAAGSAAGTVPFDTASFELLKGIATASSKAKVDPIVLGRRRRTTGRCVGPSTSRWATLPASRHTRRHCRRRRRLRRAMSKLSQRRLRVCRQRRAHL